MEASIDEPRIGFEQPTYYLQLLCPLLIITLLLPNPPSLSSSAGLKKNNSSVRFSLATMLIEQVGKFPPLGAGRVPGKGDPLPS